MESINLPAGMFGESPSDTYNVEYRKAWEDICGIIGVEVKCGKTAVDNFLWKILSLSLMICLKIFIKGILV